MGRLRATQQASDQTDDQSDQSFTTVDRLGGRLGWREIELLDELEVGAELHRRAKGNSKASYELGLRGETVTFGDVSGNRWRCSTDLVGQREVAAERRLSRSLSPSPFPGS